jgi:hypothetical protein
MTRTQKLTLIIVIVLILLAALVRSIAKKDDVNNETALNSAQTSGLSLAPKEEVSTEDAAQTISTGMQGRIVVGPGCPESDPDYNNEKCDFKPLQTGVTIASADGSRIIKHITSTTTGLFTTALSPGKYEVRGDIQKSVPPFAPLPRIIEVKSNELKSVTFIYDTDL